MIEVGYIPRSGLTEKKKKFASLCDTFLSSGYEFGLFTADELRSLFPEYSYELDGRKLVQTGRIRNGVYTAIRKYNYPISIHQRGNDLYFKREETA